MTENMDQSEATSAMTRDERNLTVSFIQFLRQKVSANQFLDDQAEAIEVAVQCLEDTFTLTDKNYAFQPSKPLLEIFKEAEGVSEENDEFPEPSKAEIEEANKLKEEGNELVKASKLQGAVQKYNQAIKLNRDPIYFCNRAAAYCRLDQYDLAVQDCRTALALDPKYAKAYGRMGVALSCQKRYDHAVEAYKHAVELDPSNDSYKTNLAIAESKLRESQQANGEENATPGFPGFSGGLGNLDLGGLGGMLNNPQMAQMAAQMMGDMNVQGLMGQMMGAFAGQGRAIQQDAANPNQLVAANPNQQGGINNLMRVGEQIAEVLSAQNPELVEQLRQQFNATRGPNNDEAREPNDDQP